MARHSRVTGDREVARAFRELARFVATPSTQASRHALRPMLQTARRLAPKGETGDFRRALAITRARRMPRLQPVFFITARGAMYRLVWLLEWGRRPSLKADGTIGHPGHRGFGMLRQAFDLHKEDAVRRFGERFVAEIIKRAEALGRRR